MDNSNEDANTDKYLAITPSHSRSITWPKYPVKGLVWTDMKL